MSTEKPKKAELAGYFWDALSIELALRGLHPDMSKADRELVAMRYGKRSLLWLPFDVGLRVVAMRDARYMKDTGALSNPGEGDGPR